MTVYANLPLRERHKLVRELRCLEAENPNVLQLRDILKNKIPAPLFQLYPTWQYAIQMPCNVFLTKDGFQVGDLSAGVEGYNHYAPISTMNLQATPSFEESLRAVDSEAARLCQNPQAVHLVCSGDADHGMIAAIIRGQLRFKRWSSQLLRKLRRMS